MTSAGNICVAIVDDDESVCRSLARLLRASAIQTVAYRSAEDFLTDAERPVFDCVLLDIQLDGLSGIELNQRLASSGSTTPVIFLTAHDEPEVREKALRTPCIAYLRKSEPAQSVFNAIARATKRSEVGHSGPTGSMNPAHAEPRQSGTGGEHLGTSERKDRC